MLFCYIPTETFFHSTPSHCVRSVCCSSTLLAIHSIDSHTIHKQVRRGRIKNKNNNNKNTAAAYKQQTTTLANASRIHPNRCFVHTQRHRHHVTSSRLMYKRARALTITTHSRLISSSVLRASAVCVLAF